jgi:hypothetical protein
MEYYLFTAWMYVMIYTYVKIVKAHLITIEISKELRKKPYNIRQRR